MIIKSVADLVKRGTLEAGDSIAFTNENDALGIGSLGMPWSVEITRSAAPTQVVDKSGNPKRIAYLLSVPFDGRGGPLESEAEAIAAAFYGVDKRQLVMEDMGDSGEKWPHPPHGTIPGRMAMTQRLILGLLAACGQITTKCKEVEIEGNTFCIDKVKEALAKAE